MRVYLTIFLLIFHFGLTTFGQIKKHNDYMIRFSPDKIDVYGYKDTKGRVVIDTGKYAICYTDTFRNYAIVLKHHFGFVAIDRKENILYTIYPFDNGPDDESDGLFRIIKDKKIGYAEYKTGKIVIKPQFDCAFPFKDGVAKVSNNCTTKPIGEYKEWISNDWFFVDKKGRKTTPPHEE